VLGFERKTCGSESECATHYTTAPHNHGLNLSKAVDSSGQFADIDDIENTIENINELKKCWIVCNLNC